MNIASDTGGVCPNNPANTVLVVEDNPQAAKLLSLYLLQAGYRVLIAQNGREALEMAARCRPMAITLDLLLPDQDGWQVLAELKAAPITRDIPVMIVSVLDRQMLGFRLGASEYLVKPVERDKLIHALKRCIPRGGKPYVCHRIMVVHTDLDELNLLAMSLARQSHEIIQALGAQEAASLAKSARPELVVTNLLEVGSDFFALIEALQAAPETARIPVLALTAGILDSKARTKTLGEIEYVLMGDDELLEDRLAAAITLLLGKN